jgi:hypothetical protein
LEVNSTNIRAESYRPASAAQRAQFAIFHRLFDQETIDGALAHFVGGVTGTYQRSKHLEARES